MPRVQTSPIDVIIGENIQMLRTNIGWSRTQLGEKLSVSHQQLKKYEKGINRVNPYILTQIRNIFNISIDSLFNKDDDSFESKRQILEFTRLFPKLPKREQKALTDYLRVRIS